MTFSSILIDPPWAERGGGKIKRGADKHYPLMGRAAIVNAIIDSGVWEPDPACCSVWMWATVNHLPDALWVLEKLEATYVTNAVWVKATRETREIRRPVIIPQSPGLGQRMRVCHEHLLYARIGRVPVPAPADRLPSTIYAPRREHSRKPDEQYELIERHDGPGARLEMFAREGRAGWGTWGNEVKHAA